LFSKLRRLRVARRLRHNYYICVVNYIWINRDAAARVANCAFSFKAVVCDGQFDRAFFAQISHESLAHLALNMGSVVSLQQLEQSQGSLAYLKLIAVVMFMSAAIMLALSFIMFKHTGQQHHLTSSDMISAIGYSCVLFGMTSFQSVSAASASVSVLGLRLPALFAPFASLVLVSLIVPAASFTGHVSGILAGFITGALALQLLLLVSFLITLPLLCVLCIAASTPGRTRWHCSMSSPRTGTACETLPSPVEAAGRSSALMPVF
jgi:membrane associated rhomboid family serine protease